jgi:hypothetical protein
MPAEARIASTWKKQKFFVAVILIGFGGWFFLDGFRTYPRSNERWKVYNEYKKDGRLGEWAPYAKNHGWTEEPPHKEYTQQDIIGQYVFGSLAVVVGGLILAYWATQIRGVLRTDDEAVYTPAGTRVPFGAITGVGKKKWDSKGIAKVRYELDGKPGQFIVDDYKFEAEPARKILAEIEEKLVARTPEA